MSKSYDIDVVEHNPDKPDLKTTFSGGGLSAAAMLRALANEIDPPRLWWEYPAEGLRAVSNKEVS